MVVQVGRGRVWGHLRLVETGVMGHVGEEFWNANVKRGDIVLIL